MLLSITVLPKFADVMHDRTTPQELIDKSPLLQITGQGAGGTANLDRNALYSLVPAIQSLSDADFPEI